MTNNRSVKVLATKEINACTEYFCDLVNEVIMQHPQPNGMIFLHGEPITYGRVKRASNELNKAILNRKKLDYPAMIEGQWYEVNGKKVRGFQTRKAMLYQGQDLGRNYTFVSDKGMLKVAESQLLSINPVQTTKP